MKKQTGFTIIELMITLAMVAILAGYAVPALQDLISNNRSTAQANNFLAALTLARSEAIKRRAAVDVVAVNGANANNEWGPGWQVVFDGTVIRDFEATTGSTLNSIDNVTTVSFGATGMTGASLSFELMPDNNDADFARCIQTSRTGRAVVNVATCP